MVITVLLTLQELTDDYEVIVVNDGSADYTAEVPDELAWRYERVRVIHHPQNRGYGGALRTGFANATKVPVYHFHRAYGNSQFFNFRCLFRVGVGLVKLWWRLVFGKEHIKAWASSDSTCCRLGGSNPIHR